MKKERILKLGKIVYLKLFNEFGYIEDKKYVYFKDKKTTYDCEKIFWRFYKIYNLIK